MKEKCIICKSELTGKQTMYCSRKCANQSINRKHKDYKCQQKRGKKRKQDLIDLKGGCCEKCGYKRNYAGLCFHHVDPSQKSFQIELRNCSNRSWEALLAEAEKCQLLCLICHAEVHNPDSFT